MVFVFLKVQKNQILNNTVIEEKRKVDHFQETPCKLYAYVPTHIVLL